MERLSFSPSSPYNAFEAAVHLARYTAAAATCRGRRVLDIACGEGYGSRFLKDAGAQSVVGVDISEEAIASAKLNFGCEGVDFINADIFGVNTCLGNRKFDMIVSLETFEHLSNPIKFLQSLNELSEPGCVIIISCPNDYFFYPDPHDSNPYHSRKYRFHEFQEMTTGILGDDAQWVVGSPIIGFGNVPIGSKSMATENDSQMTMMEYVVQRHSLMVPADAKDWSCIENSAYFIGIWGCESDFGSNSATYPIDMEKYSRFIVAEQKYDSLIAELNYSERIRKKTEMQAFALFEENKILKERIVKFKESEDAFTNLQNELSEIRIELSKYRKIKKIIPEPMKKFAKKALKI